MRVYSHCVDIIDAVCFYCGKDACSCPPPVKHNSLLMDEGECRCDTCVDSGFFHDAEADDCECNWCKEKNEINTRTTG